jgi:hypothetical protein
MCVPGRGSHPAGLFWQYDAHGQAEKLPPEHSCQGAAAGKQSHYGERCHAQQQAPACCREGCCPGRFPALPCMACQPNPCTAWHLGSGLWPSCVRLHTLSAAAGAGAGAELERGKWLECLPPRVAWHGLKCAQHYWQRAQQQHRPRQSQPCCVVLCAALLPPSS